MSKCSLKKAISKTMSLVIGLVIIIAVVAGVLIYLTSQPTPTTTTTKPVIEEVKIGIIEPLTGRYAVFGQEAVDAAKLLVDIINNELGGVSSLGGAKLKLYVEDAGTSPDSAALAAERLISNYRPHVILGAYISRLTAAVAEVTEREKIPLVMDALVDWLTERGWNYVFRIAPRASAHGKAAVDFVLEMARKTNVTIRTVVVLHEDSIFGTTVANGVRSELIANGVIPNETITYAYTITDFGPIISKIRDLNPDVIFSVPYFSDGILFAKALQASGIKVKFIAGAGGCGYTDPDSIREAGEAVEYFTNTYSYNPARQTEWNKRIVQEFQQKYGKLPTEAAGIIFYSLMFIYEGLEKAGQMFPENPLNPDNLKAAFLSLDLNDSNSKAAQLYPTGKIKLAANGENLYGGTAILQVIGGQPKVIWPEAEAGVTPVFPRP
jgi:branched-chain amino acid transport system substrate-binding protein